MNRKHYLSLILLCLSSQFPYDAEAESGWPENYGGVMLQSFWWDGYNATKWAELTSKAPELSQYFDLIWIPNAGTSSGDKWAMDQYAQGKADAINWSTQMGYMPCYYLDYNTIFGTEQQLLTMIDTYKAYGTGIIEDVVINHKNGVSGWCDFANEQKVGRKSGSTYTITWDNASYSGICSNDEANYKDDSEAKGKITGAEDTGDGFDGCRDLDHTNALVQQNVKTYLDYLLGEVGFAGFRYDMVKGYHPDYTGIYNTHSQPTFSVGEFWDNTDGIRWWINETGKSSAAFDFGLKYVINDVFNNGNYGALANKSLAADVNYQRWAVTFADNHDTGSNTRDDGNTETGDCPLLYNWSAANALILSLPGTPCVWYYHYKADPTNIRAMILGRKACGITNQSTITLQECTSSGNGYRLATHGTRGYLYCQFGDAVNDGTPAGYSRIASGDGYICYQKLTDDTSHGYTVYFNVPDEWTDNWSQVYAYTWKSGTSTIKQAWPGTKLQKDARGNYVFTVNEGGYDKIIFNNGTDSHKTADLDVYNHRFYDYYGATQLAYLDLADGDAGYYSIFDLQAAQATYQHTTQHQWGTLCLPFGYSSNSDVQFYQLDDANASQQVMVFTPVQQVAAGQPVVFRILTDLDAEGRYQLSIAADNVVIRKSDAGCESEYQEGWHMYGTYQPTTRQSSTEANVYYLSADSFMQATNSVSIPAYRAWFESQVASQAPFRITEAGTDLLPMQWQLPEAPAVIYDLYGHRQSSPVRGIQIMGGRKVLIK